MRLGVALRLGRVSNLPTVWTNVAAGVALAGGDFRAGTTALLLTSISLIYTAGMYLNDAFDRDFDAVAHPRRPIPSGQARLSEVFRAGFALLAAGLVLAGVAALSSPTAAPGAALAAACVLAACVVAYDAVHKRTRAAVLLMAACRALAYATAGLAAAPHLQPSLVAGMAALFAYITGLTAVARQETAQRLSNPWPLALLALAAAVAVWLGRDEPAALAFAVLFGGWTLTTVRPLLGARSAGARHDVALAVSQMIAGICLLDAALIASRGYVAIAVLAAFGAVLTRLLQRSIPGT